MLAELLGVGLATSIAIWIRCAFAPIAHNGYWRTCWSEAFWMAGLVMPVEQPRVSLCTITRNRSALLELLGASVMAQAYPPQRLEWVIVDDSSEGPLPDLTPVEEAGIAVRYRRLPERLPIGAKRNLCHSEATGELLVLLDDDDYYPPTRVPDALAALQAGEALVAGCDRMPLLLLPEGSLWLTPGFGPGHVTANTLAYWRRYVEEGHAFDAQAEEAEEASFLEGFTVPVQQLDPWRTLTCIGHGGNTVDKRLWIARIGQHRFEQQVADGSGHPPLDFLVQYCRALGLPWQPPDQVPAVPANQSTTQHWRVAVVTPYCNETPEVLARCHRSVLAQDYACTHVLVADGPGLPEVASWNCRHIALGVGHDDNGNTPRCLGAMAAMNESFDCIAFLDADNWLAPEHISSAIAVQASSNCSVVFSDRHIVFPDGQRLTQLPLEDQRRRHVDTSCMVLFAPAFSCLALWAQMPRLLAPQCDRVLFYQLKANHRCSWTGRPTVFFETWYANHFLAAGLLPPLNAKFLPLQPAMAWEEAAEAFRQRSPTPLYLEADGIAPDKPRIQLVSLLGPACSHGTALQAALCRHLGFRGIPEHQLLYHCVQHLGSDHRQRHQGEDLRGLLAQGLPSDPYLKPHDQSLRGLEQALREDRSYTLLEAYFRTVQALLPAEAMAFAKSYGQVTVLDRSCTHSLVADVLFNCLPEHRAVLLLRDPLQQIASVLLQQRCFPDSWSADQPMGVEQLAEVYLRSLAVPLQAAPVGQLHVIMVDDLLAAPDLLLERVCRFLGLETNILLALEPCSLPADYVPNTVHAESCARQVAQLPSQLLHEEPWKDPGLGWPPTQNELIDILSEEEQSWLEDLMAPIREVIVHRLEGQACFAQQQDLGKKTECLPVENELQALVIEVVNALSRHLPALSLLV
ncbi:MAG: glycosyltransferase family 2 protein [Cyanobacteriota bacterium]|jgi:hypothetical protein